MFFNIDVDSGDAISGWLAPDNPSQVPKVAIRISGRPEIIMDANVDRPDVRDLGLHGSSQVGFLITDETVPSLALIEDIEILEADTLIPIYRRYRPDRHLERKLFLFESSAMPQRAMMDGFTARFALNYTNCERYSLETMIVLLNNNFSKSLFFSGRSSFSRYASFLENGGFIRAALLREPLHELAERLLFLKLLAKPNAEHLVPAFATGLKPLIDFAKNLRLDDSKALLSAFRQIDDQQRQALISPMVRMLGCTLDEVPTHNHVSLALDHLASLDVVGTREQFLPFKAMLKHFLGGEDFEIEAPMTLPSVHVLADTLSRIGIVIDLLEHDLALYNYVDDSVSAGLRGHGHLAVRDTQAI